MLKSLAVDFSRCAITENDCGRRLDRVLRRLLPGIPLSAIYRLLRKGAIRLDGKKALPGAICRLNSVIEIESRIAGGELKPRAEGKADKAARGMPARGESEASAFIKKITVLETPDILFLNKPQGVATHGEGSLSSMLPRPAGEAASLSFRAGPLHRLDKNTTGIIAFSKTLIGARWFSGSIKKRKITKLYAGILETNGKALAPCLWTDEGDASCAKGAKRMETCVCPVAAAKGLALAVFSLRTGRKRQIRRQAAMRGMPLLGDAQFGGSRCGGGYFLHAGLMAFPEERLEGLPPLIEAPFPERFSQASRALFGEGAGALADIFRMVYASV